MSNISGSNQRKCDRLVIAHKIKLEPEIDIEIKEEPLTFDDEQVEVKEETNNSYLDEETISLGELSSDHDLNEESDHPPDRRLTHQKLIRFFRHIDSAIRIINQNDPNSERSSQVSKAIQQSVLCYKKYCKRKRSRRKVSFANVFVDSKCYFSRSDPGPSWKHDPIG